MPTELTDLEVDRVDAVDRPATRRKFLILKAEGDPAAAAAAASTPAAGTETPAGDPAAAAAEAQVLLAKAGGALGALRKAEGLTLPADVVTAMNELIDAVGDSTIAKFEVAKAADDDAAKAKAAADAKAAAEATAKAAAPFDEDRLAEKIAKGIVDGIRKAADDEATGEGQPFVPTSSQPAGQPVTKAGPRKMGEGLFTNIVMGRNS